MEIKVRGENQLIEQLFASPDARGLPVRPGGRLHRQGEWTITMAVRGTTTSYIQCVGIATITDSLSAIHTHLFHRVGTVTNALSQMRRGDVIGVRGPFGSNWPIEKANGLDVCIVAGGIGLAPLRPVLYSLFRRRRDYGRVLLLYGARSPLDLLYRVELEQWSKQYDVEVLVTVDRSDSTWKGYIGVVPNLFSYIKLDARATMAMVCGPEVMMQYTIAEILRCGVPPEQIYLSMERNMKCAVGFCGHCQYGPKFICKDGPVFAFPQISDFFGKKEI